MSKILCPFHQEDTPSLEIYSDGYKCFGCGAQGSLKHLEQVGVEGVTAPPKVPPEDIKASLQEIKKFPKKSLRGFDFPSDDQGFYIMWPNNEFYKKRLFSPGKKGKYIGPRGHKPPLFYIKRGSNTLYLVEGEINALSVAKAIPTVDVCSPGGTSQFDEDALTLCVNYDTVVLVVDKDPAGIIAYIQISSKLVARGINTYRILMSEDANEVLMAYGEKELQKRLADAGRGMAPGPQTG